MRRNVLQLIDSFRLGGSESQAVQLARLLHESGRYRVHVACLDRSGPLFREAERLEVGEIPEYPLNSFYDRNAIVQVRRFARFLREREIDVVHAHDFYSNIFGMMGAALARVPVRIASRRESAKRSAVKRRLERGAYRLAHAVVANCEEIRRQLIDEGVAAQKIETLYNGLDTSRVAAPPDLRREDALDLCGLPRTESRRRFISIVANLRAVKDHATFLRAARRVRARVPESAFIIAGEGELDAALRSLAGELELARDVFFIGRCERVAELLSLSEACVLSSTSEGFSNSILEYMAAARPVVVTDVGGAREVVEDGETGYLVAAGDDERMAARLVGLLNEPERARLMGERGARLVEQKFSCGAQLERAEVLYERLLARVKVPRARGVESVRRESA
jgi:glycosyltransferase involved in cell wall biosynthesis